MIDKCLHDEEKKKIQNNTRPVFSVFLLTIIYIHLLYQKKKKT